ncbi:MAG: cell division transport system permease protein [Frankiaceae bacterium]|nr:cell division transport system permease protein [Frankiaceae bacterium]
MRSQFVTSELFNALRRNTLMVVAVVITVAISLWFAFAGVLMRKQVDVMKGYWYDKVEVSIFLAKDVTEDQRTTLQADLSSNPQVKTVYYESHEDALKRFKEDFKDSPDLLKDVTAQALPESFRVKLKDPRRFDDVASEFAGRPGIDEIKNQREVLQPFFRMIERLQWTATAIAVVQLFAGALLIGITIKVAAFSRRRETGIMRLVGASNLYIQLPFLLEGAVEGAIGGLLAVGLLALTKKYVIDELRQSISFTSWIGWSDVVSVMPFVMLAGIALSVVASFISLRRYLRV